MTLKTAYATIVGFEVMRALRKGQAAVFNLTRDIRGEARIVYIPRTLLLAYNKGVKRTYLYEMIDEVSSVGYGLLAADLSEKPAFTAVKNLIGVLTDAGSTFNEGSLSYSVSRASSSLHHTLLQKRDGSFWLVLWSEQSSYHPATNGTVAVIPQTIHLKCFGSVKPQQVITLDETGALTSTSVIGGSNSVKLSISDQVTIMKIK